MGEEKKQMKLGEGEVAGFKDMPMYNLRFQDNNKWVNIGLYKDKERDYCKRKNPVTIPAGAYLFLFKVDPERFKKDIPDVV